MLVRILLPKITKILHKNETPFLCILLAPEPITLDKIPGIPLYNMTIFPTNPTNAGRKSLQGGQVYAIIRVKMQGRGMHRAQMCLPQRDRRKGA